jgi:hypothetical protein
MQQQSCYAYGVLVIKVENSVKPMQFAIET